MPKENNHRVLEVRSGSGQLLFSLWLIERDMVYPAPSKEEPKLTQEKGDAGEKREGRKETAPGTNDSTMSEAQKRYLFRILAEQGFEAEAAHEELKKTFRVDTLKKVSKLEASREIERRLEALKEGA